MQHLNHTAYLANLRGSTSKAFDYTIPGASGEWENWKSDLREHLEAATGLPRIAAMGAQAPLAARGADFKEFETYTQEKLFILTEPGIEIPCYLLLPKNAPGPVPLILTPHGHNKYGKETYSGNYHDEADRDQAIKGERDIALQAVQEGYAAIAPDMRAFNEMSREVDFPQHNSSCTELQRVAELYGRTLIGERVHDIARLIDYAGTRSEIGSNKIIITGNSGGGTVSLFAAALDERISICVPGSYFCTFFDSIVSISHCPCGRCQ